jgi:acetylglutamate kinase
VKHTKLPPFGRVGVGYKIYDNMKLPLTIVKVGGAVVEDSARLDSLLSAFAAIDGRKVLVHGGGRRATAIASRLSVESRMVDGRRVTDGAMLEVVTMVYGGLVNKDIVARLQARGINSIGLTGADGGVILSHKRPVKDVDYGFVGDVDRVDGSRLSSLIEGGFTPVMAPLTHDGHGQMLNTNADTIAAETAKALAERYDVTLMYCFEKPGVMAEPDDDSTLIPVITRQDFRRLKADGTVTGGMLPKLENAFSAIDAGVSRVNITLATAIDGRHGTMVVP